MIEPDKSQTTIWRMRFALWITNSTNTHSYYVIIRAFPRQKYLRERASMLRYVYCLSCLLHCQYFRLVLTSRIKWLMDDE
jgi:hypothetical protein